MITTWFSDPMRHIAFDLATGVRTCELPSLGGGEPFDGAGGLACQQISTEPPPEPPPA